MEYATEPEAPARALAGASGSVTVTNVGSTVIKSLSIWAFPGGPEGTINPVSAMERARALGYDAIELAVNEQNHLTADADEGYCRNLRVAAERIGVRIASLACGIGWSHSLSAPDAAKRKAAVRTHAKCLQVARWLGVDAALVIPGYVYIPWEPKVEPVPYDRAYGFARQSLRELARTAAKVRVHVCCENVWGGMLYSPLEFKRLLDEVASRWVNMYLDTANMMAFGYPEHWLAVLGRRIKRVHFKDFRRDPGGITGFCDLLTGDVNYAAVMAALRRLRYKGPVTLETFNRTDDDLRKESAAMDRILRM